MKSEYGMVPLPKYDANQTEYDHYLDIYRTCLSIPATNSQDDIERLSIILEDTAYKSSEEILTAFVDEVISLRRARVPELGEMVKLIRKTICYDVATLFTAIDYKSILATAVESGNASSSFSSVSRVFQKKRANLAKKLACYRLIPQFYYVRQPSDKFHRHDWTIRQIYLLLFVQNAYCFNLRNMVK